MASLQQLFTVNSFILNLSDRIRVSAKRYIPQYRSGENDVRRDVRVIILFAHALGFHKEHWEPVIQELYQRDCRTDTAIIQEAWGLDCPDHGESAILNEAELESGTRYISCREYGDAFISLVRSGFLDGRCKLVFVGHSAGAVSGILSTARYHASGNNPFSSMVLIEPAIISQGLFSSPGVRNAVTQLSRFSGARRDMWSSVADAKSWLMQRSPWKSWDPRVLDRYVQFGIRPLPTRIYPSSQTGVTLSFPRLTHSLAYNNLQDQHDAMDQLKAICLTPLKIRVIFGGRIDYNPIAVQDEIASVVEGSPSGSVSYIKDVGHMIVQESPTQVAASLYEIIHEDYRNISSKL